MPFFSYKCVLERCFSYLNMLSQKNEDEKKIQIKLNRIGSDKRVIYKCYFSEMFFFCQFYTWQRKGTTYWRRSTWVSGWHIITSLSNWYKKNAVQNNFIILILAPIWCVYYENQPNRERIYMRFVCTLTRIICIFFLANEHFLREFISLVLTSVLCIETGTLRCV